MPKPRASSPGRGGVQRKLAARPASALSAGVSHDFHALPVQAKLDVTSATDRFEAEADSMADHVVHPNALNRAPPLVSSLSGVADGSSVQNRAQRELDKPKDDDKETSLTSSQRRESSRGKVQLKGTAASAATASTKGRKEEERSQPKPPPLQRKAAATGRQVGKATHGEERDKGRRPEPSRAPAQRDAVSGGGFAVPAATEHAIQSMRAGGGSPLAPPTRTFMEQRIGHDFSGVRVHDSPAAHQAARDLDARAFTVGRDVFFGVGNYAPNTAGGQHLLAHELTHTVQQGSGSSGVHAKRLQRDGAAGTSTPGGDGDAAGSGGAPEAVTSSTGVSPPAGGPETGHAFGPAGGIQVGGQSNGRAGLLTVPTFPVLVIDGINKGGSPPQQQRSARPADGVNPIQSTGLDHEYLYLGAPQGRRTGAGSKLYAYQLWDRDAAALSPRLQANLPATIENEENAANVLSNGEVFYFLVHKRTGSRGGDLRNVRNLFLGTASELARNTRILRPNWRMASQNGGGPADFDPDHAHELQFGGADSIDNLWLLDSTANQNFGGNANRHVDTQLTNLVSQVRRSPFWTQYRAANPTATLPADGREARDHWNIRFLGYTALDPGGHPGFHYTQHDIAEGKQTEELRALSDAELIRAGLRPPAGSSVNFLNLFYRPGGGERFVLETNEQGNWVLRQDVEAERRAGRETNQIKGFRIGEVNINPQRGGVGTNLGTITGTPFVEQQQSGVFAVGPSPPPLTIIQADPEGYSAYIAPEHITPNRDSFRFNGLSPILFDQHGVSPSGAYYARGEIEATKFLFPGLRIGIIAQGDQIYASAPIPTESLNFGPVSVRDAALDVGYDHGLFLRGMADVVVEGVGSGHLEATASARGPRVEGDFNFDVDFLDPASARFVYDMATDELSLSLTAGVKDGTLPGIERGQVTATVDREGFDISGSLFPSGFLSGAEIAVSYTRETGITIELRDYRPPLDRVPAIQNAVVSLGINKPPGADQWRYYGSGSADFALPYVTGGLSITVNNGVITIIGIGNVERAPAAGTLNVTVTNQEIDEQGNPIEGQALDEFRVFGRGTVSLTFGIITATAGIELTEEGEIIVSGQLALPPSYQLFPERRYERELLHIEPPEIPIWGVSLAGVGFGIFAFFDAYLKFDAFVGPGTLNDVQLNATYTFGHPEDTVIDGTANFNIPAGAGFTVDIGGGLRARVAVAQVSGRIGLAARLGLEANAGADVNVHWTPQEGLSLAAEAYANVSPKFRVSANASVTASVDLWLTELSHTWGPWEQVLGEFGPDMMVEARFPVAWSERDGLDLDVEDITVRRPEVDYASLMTDAFLELV